MDEFALIRRYFAAAPAPGVVLGIGDDAALLQPRSGYELAVSSDTLVAGRHFPPETAPADVGWKALAVNLSDLAAMGAEPRWFTLALTLPEPDAGWLAGFSDGLLALARAQGIALVGGDTTRGPLALTITVIGEVPAGRALRRATARADEMICVTGTLGDAAAALRQLHSGAIVDEALRARLDRPQPRVAEGLLLRELASAAIDLSDGLGGDLRHLLDASGVGAQLLIDRLPASAALCSAVPDAQRRAQLQLEGGDDYELCVCLPPDRLAAALRVLAVPLTVVGRTTAEPGLRLQRSDGVTMDWQPAGYQHF